MEDSDFWRFFGQYKQSYSYFSNSTYAALDLPSARELKLLNQVKEHIPSEVFTTVLTPVATTKKGQLRQNLRLAKKLLSQAGWNYKDGALRNKDGLPFEFEIMLPVFDRISFPVKDVAFNSKPLCSFFLGGFLF